MVDSKPMNNFPTRRMRRLRTTAALREMLAETRLSHSDLIAPLFVRGGSQVRRPIESMPGQCQFSADVAADEARRWADLGIPAVLLFGIPDHKDPSGTGAWDPAGPVPETIGRIKKVAPEMVVIADVCLLESFPLA